MQDFKVEYSEEFISSLWCRKIPNTIAEQAQEEWLEWYYTEKEKGKYKGRKKIEVNDNFKSVYKSWKAGEITATKAMELTGLKRNTFYRRVSEYEEN